MSPQTVSRKLPSQIKDDPFTGTLKSDSALADGESENAKKELVRDEFLKLEYPKTIRIHVDPQIPSQNIGLFSFIPSKGCTPDKQGCFGVLKLRGNFPTREVADKKGGRNYPKVRQLRKHSLLLCRKAVTTNGKYRIILCRKRRDRHSKKNRRSSSEKT